MTNVMKLLIAAVAASCCLCATVRAADEHEHEHEHGFGGRGDHWSGPGRIDGHGQVLDGRYDHGRYYPPFGSSVRFLPGDYRPYYFHGSPYYFNAGIWYAPGPGGFLVVRPPVGLVVSVLPPYYSTVWIGGLPYYYADNVYYTYAPEQNGYAVVDPPPGANQPAAPPAPAVRDDLMVYPKNGQSSEQQAADRYECHTWAKGQTGFDPTQPGGGVAPGSSDQSRGNYNRAMSACLQARGYQVN